VLGRRDADGRLVSAQTAMTLQEEAIKRAERERCQLVERLDAMERRLVAADNDKLLLQVTSAPHVPPPNSARTNSVSNRRGDGSFRWRNLTSFCW